MNRISVRLRSGWERFVDPETLDRWRPRPFELEGGLTELVEIGDGPPLLLVPPLPGFKEVWLECAARLAAHFRVVSFDLRARFAHGPEWEPLLADLDRVADALAPGIAVLAGHSLGGLIAQRWALRHPERVSALVLSSSFAHLDRPAAFGRAWRMRYLEQPAVLASQRLLPAWPALALARQLAARQAWVYDRSCGDAVLERVRLGVRSTPIGLARAQVRLALAHDTRAELAALRCPTLVIAGEREGPLQRAAGEELARLIPGASLRLSPGASHLHPMSNAHWLAETLAAWLPLAGAGGTRSAVSP